MELRKLPLCSMQWVPVAAGRAANTSLRLYHAARAAGCQFSVIYPSEVHDAIVRSSGHFTKASHRVGADTDLRSGFWHLIYARPKRKRGLDLMLASGLHEENMHVR